MKTYDKGDNIGLSCDFTDSLGDASDPGTVSVLVRKPDGSSTAPTASSPAVGTWEASVIADQEGHWFYSFTGTSPVVAVGEGQFYIRRRRA